MCQYFAHFIDLFRSGELLQDFAALLNNTLCLDRGCFFFSIANFFFMYLLYALGARLTFFATALPFLARGFAFSTVVVTLPPSSLISCRSLMASSIEVKQEHLSYQRQ